MTKQYRPSKTPLENVARALYAIAETLEGLSAAVSAGKDGISASVDRVANRLPGEVHYIDQALGQVAGAICDLTKTVGAR